MADDNKTPMEQAGDKRRFWKTVLAIVGTPVAVALAIVTRGRIRGR